MKYIEFTTVYGDKITAKLDSLALHKSEQRPFSQQLHSVIIYGQYHYDISEEVYDDIYVKLFSELWGNTTNAVIHI